MVPVVMIRIMRVLVPVGMLVVVPVLMRVLYRDGGRWFLKRGDPDVRLVAASACCTHWLSHLHRHQHEFAAAEDFYVGTSAGTQQDQVSHFEFLMATSATGGAPRFVDHQLRAGQRGARGRYIKAEAHGIRKDTGQRSHLHIDRSDFPLADSVEDGFDKALRD
ncbi:hypothetical protein NicSoilB8_06320 [Arthrobacter sp. NicSoilB8]|nr:hypothetical protein NicSoilB8_06320 [Arthrobacter sp. NicSoilB8]